MVTLELAVQCVWEFLQTPQNREVLGWIFMMIAGAIALIIGGPALAGKDCPVPVEAAGSHYADQVAELLQELPSTRKRVLVVLDGLDEALGGGFDASIFPSVAVPGLKILLSARLEADSPDASGWLRRLGWEIGANVERPLELKSLDPDGVADVLVRMGAPLAVLSAQRHLVERLTYLTEGEPLLLRYYAEDLWQRREAAQRFRVEDLDAMKPGFAAYFQRWLNDQEKAWRDEGASVDPLAVDATLAVLACAFGPLGRDDLARLVNEVHGVPFVLSTQRLLKPVRRFVMRTPDADTEGGYILSHPKIGQYLRDDYLNASAVRMTFQGFADWGRRTVAALNAGSLPPARAPIYLLEFYVQHLGKVDGTLDDFMPLAENGWRRAWEAREGGSQGFTNDVQLTWTVLRS